MKVSAYSPSKLAAFQTCPRFYAFRYIWKIPSRIRANQSFGSSMHRALQALYQAGGPQGRTVEELQAQLARSWSNAGYADAQEAEAELRRGQELLVRYASTWAQEASIPFLQEKRLSAPYRDVVFLGVIDRVDRARDGSLHVIDYKSGWSPADGRIPVPSRWQLALYHHLLQVKFAEAPGHHSIHYLANDVRLKLDTTTDRVEDLLEAAYDVAVAIREAIGGQRFDPQVGRHCHRCDYLSRCAEGRAVPLESEGP